MDYKLNDGDMIANADEGATKWQEIQTETPFKTQTRREIPLVKAATEKVSKFVN